MSAVVMRNNRKPGGPVVPPVHSDGTDYRFCMYFRGDADVAFADSTVELVDVLLPGYTELDGNNRFAKRVQLAQSVATWTQALLLAEARPDELSPDENTVLLSARGATPPNVSRWTSHVPLVVVETSYAPFTHAPCPESVTPDVGEGSNVWWVRPADEDDFLLSLHEVGHITLMRSEPL